MAPDFPSPGVREIAHSSHGVPMSHGSPGSFRDHRDEGTEPRTFEESGWSHGKDIATPLAARATSPYRAGSSSEALTSPEVPAEISPDRTSGASIASRATSPVSDPGNRVALTSARTVASADAMDETLAGSTSIFSGEDVALVLAAPGFEPSATPPASPAPGETRANANPSTGARGLARPIHVSLAPTPSRTPLRRPRATPDIPKPQPSDADSPAHTSRGEIETPDEMRGHSPGALPPPRGADLITEMTAFDRESDEEPLAWLLDRLRGDGVLDGQADASPSPYLIHVVFALVAFEAARRRWQSRTSAGMHRPRRARSFMLHGPF
jgi:hypothetical protein